MARRKRKEVFRIGDYTLGRRGADAVAEYSDPRTGVRRRVRIGSDLSERDAKSALERFASSMKSTTATKPTVAKLWAAWLDDRAEDGFSNDIYRANWVSLDPVFGHRDPEKITVKDCRDYARMRFDLKRAPATVWTELTRLRHCMKWAAKRRLIPWAPDIWVPGKGGSRKRVLTPQEAQALIKAAEQGDPHVYLFVVLAFSTGARHTAILDLTWDRVDWIAGTIQFDENIPPDPMNRSWRKGRATVAMNRKVRAALETAHAGRQTDHVIEHGGRRLVTVKNGFANAVKRAGIAHCTPHSIRHTVSTWLAGQGIDIETRAQLLGHADINTTAGYTHEYEPATYLRKAVDVIDTQLEREDVDSDVSSVPGSGTPLSHMGQKPSSKKARNKGQRSA